MSPPTPVIIGSTTFSTAAAATAASTALPPSCKIRRPACAAGGWLAATRPFRASTGERVCRAHPASRSPGHQSHCCMLILTDAAAFKLPGLIAISILAGQHTSNEHHSRAVVHVEDDAPPTNAQAPPVTPTCELGYIHRTEVVGHAKYGTSNCFAVLQWNRCEVFLGPWGDAQPPRHYSDGKRRRAAS